jgi:hypothetical protein
MWEQRVARSAKRSEALFADATTKPLVAINLKMFSF